MAVGPDKDLVVSAASHGEDGSCQTDLVGPVSPSCGRGREESLRELLAQHEARVVGALTEALASELDLRQLPRRSCERGRRPAAALGEVDKLASGKHRRGLGEAMLNDQSVAATRSMKAAASVQHEDSAPPKACRVRRKRSSIAGKMASWLRESKVSMYGIMRPGGSTRSGAISTLADRELKLKNAHRAATNNFGLSSEPTLSRAGGASESTTGEGTTVFALRSSARRLVSSRFFETLVLAAIVVNIAVVGWQADWSVKNPGGDVPVYFRFLDVFFCLFFTWEILVRFAPDGMYLYSLANPGLQWNLLDALLVVLAWVEEIVKVASASSAPGISSMRMVRIFRCVRVMRVIRVVRFFHDLRTMIWGIAASMKSLVWALCLLCLMGFMFSVLILEFVGHELETESGATELAHVQLKASWGSLGRSVYMLYQSICGGVDWGTIVGPLDAVTPMLSVLFCAYIAMATFCVLNIITGVFVENTKSMLVKDETALVMETIEGRKQWLGVVKQLWRLFTLQEDELDYDTFSDRITDVRIQALFRRLGMDVEVETTRGLYGLLDLSSSGKVNVDEFAMAIEMLHGSAKNIDMARLRTSVETILEQVRDLTFFFHTLVPAPPVVYGASEGALTEGASCSASCEAGGTGRSANCEDGGTRRTASCEAVRTRQTRMLPGQLGEPV